MDLKSWTGRRADEPRAPETEGADEGLTEAEAARASRREQTFQHYRLAAVLFLGGGLGAIAPDALHQPAHPATVYLLPLLAIVSGLILWALAARLPRSGLHAIAVIATLEVALTVALADRVFAIYYTFVAIYAAYVFTSRRAILLHVLFTSMATFAPMVYDPDAAREGLIAALVLTPTLVLAAGTVAYLRERLATSEERYRHLSECDPLTGVGNYRMLSARVPRELRRHARFGRSLGLITIDLDDFKQVNDSYGHQRGDAVLQQVGRALLDGVREHDIVVRQGGDEFAVVAPETDGPATQQLADRLTEAIGRISADGTSIGASVGLARFPEDADSLEGLLAAADERLRSTKRERPSIRSGLGGGALSGTRVRPPARAEAAR